MTTINQLAATIQNTEALIKTTIKEIDSFINTHKRRTKSLQKKIAKYQKAIDIINNKQTALSILEALHNNLKIDAAEKKAVLVEKLNKVINIDEILKSISIMARTIRMQRASAKRDFWDAQKVIDNAAVELRKVGIVSKGIDKLSLMNYNRPDRDYPSSIGMDEILNLKEITKVEE